MSKKFNPDEDFQTIGNKTRPKYILKYNSRAKLNWDLLIIVLAIFNSLLIPINAAFNPDFTNTYTNKLINSGLINLIYLGDIFINFITSVIELRTN